MRSSLGALAVLCLLSLAMVDRATGTEIWQSPLRFVAETPALTVTPSSPSSTIRITPNSTSGPQWVALGLVLPSNVVIDSVLVCYELADPSSFITQVRITRVTTPDFAIVAYDDGTDLQDSGPVCYMGPDAAVSVNATMTLLLALNFADVSHWIDIGGIAFYVSDATGRQHADVDSEREPEGEH